MSKSGWLLLCLLLLFTWNMANGQIPTLLNKISFYSFVSVPQGDFGGSFSSKAGYANTGVGTAAEFSKPLNTNLYWTSSSFWSKWQVNQTLLLRTSSEKKSL